MVNALYARADVFLLTWLGTWADVGVYSAALRLVDVARTVAPAYARALYPILARLRAESADEFAALARRSLRDIVLLILPIVLVLSGFAQPLIVSLYGDKLADAGGVLRILAWSLVPTTLATTLAQILFAAKLQVVDLRVNIIASVFIVVTGAFLVPRWGAAGAAFAVLLSSGLYAGLQYTFVRRAVTDPAALPLLAKLAAVAMAGALAMAVAPPTSTLAAGGLGIAVYCVAIWATRIVGRDDVERMYGIFRIRHSPLREVR